ncbi:MAG: tRNA threonylcarbamoyladenosine dehydratase [Myxococcota bacterium]|nr:tRNA threonylcarbamoyladenosine dehydratase [Myxococcota bacterium]
MPLPMYSTDLALPPSGEAPESTYKTHRRFDRAARLFTEPGLHALMSARVLVVGIGGVGSFAAEALARSGVGSLALIDFDDVCVTNTNRQLHAMRGNIGKPKASIMAERLQLVSPTATIEPVLRFYQEDASDELLAGRVDYVVDAIDNLTAKAHLIATCLARGIPIVSSMGAAARLDPTRVRTADLADTEGCPLARDLRRLLRVRHGLELRRNHPIGVRAVFSDEAPIAPAPISYDEGTGFVCVCPNKDNGVYTCDRRARIDGSASFVTGTFGMVAASVVVRAITGR